jgi:hypothetical protein
MLTMLAASAIVPIDRTRDDPDDARAGWVTVARHYYALG